MNLVNETAFETGWTVGYQSDGREVAIVVVKGTYSLTDVDDAGAPRPRDQQEKVRLTDEFGADPETSAPVFEADMAHDKVACDVLLHGQAHVPFGERKRELAVRLRVGGMAKTMRVRGPRVWMQTLGLVGASDAATFTSQPIRYDVAFGGTEPHPKDPSRVAMYQDNPAGTGFREYDLKVQGMAMPVTEELGVNIEHPRNKYKPMSFGPLGRSWRARARYAGTYDETWLNEQAPLWPDDFNPKYFQAAPEDQQIKFPQGGEEIELVHLVPTSLVPNCTLRSQLPKQRIAVAFMLRREPACLVDAQLDTIVFEPDQNRFSCTWRARKLVTRDIFDVQEMIVGDPDGSLPGRIRALVTGKRHVRGLGELSRSKRTP
jgi:hypothetical protein